VTVEGQVNQPLAKELEATLRDVRANDSVEAVVIAIDTPGGAPAASERMYSAIQQTNEQMPVVASVGELSASGGYYAMLGAEDIYVHPTSQVGSVGLAASEPRQSPPIEGPSGPDKRGSNKIQALAQQDLLAEVFLESVMEERGDRIELSREQVSTADIFLGVRAVENGFADEIGSLEVAIDDAATRAGLEEYTVVKRDATPEGGQFPIFVQAGDRLVAVHSNDPGYGDIRPVSAAMIYEPAVPHYETIQTFVDDGNVSRTGGERP
jgi:protease-4